MLTEFDCERIWQMQHHVYLKSIGIFDRAVKNTSEHSFHKKTASVGADLEAIHLQKL